LPLVALDRVARLELVEAIEGHATLLARGDLAHVVLHAPQRRQAAVVDHLAPAQDAYQPAARDGALHDGAARRLAGLARLEGHADRGGAAHRLAVLRLQHARERPA